MKNILFASTALVGMTGAALADVDVSADARMGVIYQEGGGFVAGDGSESQIATQQAAIDILAAQVNAAQLAVDTAQTNNNAGDLAAAKRELAIAQSALEGATGDLTDLVGASGGEEFSFSSRIRIKFAASGETDGGVAFGGSIRADNAVGGGAGTAGSVFVSGAFGKISMGDVDTAGKAATGNVAGVGYTGAGDFNEISFLGNSVDPSVLYEYSFGDYTFLASLDQIGDDNTVASLGFKGSVAGFSFGIGYEDQENEGDHVILKAGYDFNGIDLQAVYGTYDDDDDSDDDFDHYAVSASFEVQDFQVTVFAKDADNQDDLSYGIGASYDLGGGAALKGGIAHSGQADSDNDIRADFGMTMSF